ncbi:response regulator [bacterium]|nr:response regulator [bacterium]
MSTVENRVLCVDDEVSILSALKRLLRKEEYTLLTASSAEEGIELLKQTTVQVVVSDQRMPGLTGVQFLQKVKAMHPDTVRVILSGYADLSVMVEAINKGEIYRFLSKPWNDEELRITIRQALDHYNLLKQRSSLLEQIEANNLELKRLNSLLEEKIAQRTHLLALSQEIMEIIPLPVVGISREGMVVLVNRAAVEYGASRQASIAPGVEIDEFLPAEIIEKLKVCLCHSETGGSMIVEWNGLKTCFRSRPLKTEEATVGCILSFEDYDA